MKASTILALAGAVAVSAQSFPDNFPECGVSIPRHEWTSHVQEITMC